MKKLLIILIPIMLIIAIIWNLQGIERDKFSSYNILTKISEISFENEFDHIQEFGQELGKWEQVEFETTGNGFLDFFVSIGQFFANFGLWLKNLGLVIYAVFDLIISFIANCIKALGFLLGYDA